MSRPITPHTTVDQLKKDAKRWLKALQAGDADARARFERALPTAPAAPTLRDVQHALAREGGYAGWTALVEQLRGTAALRRYDAVAAALVTAYREPDPSALAVVHEYFGHRRAWDGMRRYVRLDLGRTERPRDGETDDLSLDEARLLVARAQAFASWDALAQFAASAPADRPLAVKAAAASRPGDDGAPAVAVRSRDWDEILDAVRTQGLSGFHANGQMTDALLARVADLESLAWLDLDGSRAVTDAGLRHLARLPRLTRLHLGGCARITDRGLAVLRELPALESVNLAWTQISDEGAAHLAACPRLEAVDLLGTPSGDGAIRALAGKDRLRDLRSGNGVTDEGIQALHELPVFRHWQGGDVELGLLRFDAKPNFLLLRGPFTNAGLARLAGLDGLFALNVDDSRLAITGAGLAPLVNLPHLGMLAFDAKDESMPYIAALPHLRFLMCQDTSAGDDGFVALSRSRTIEYIWGRRCHNLRRRGFLALSEMPALRALSVSCLNVDDEGLAALPRFPALRELMPMDVPDEGYRHVGACGQLEALILMYCRDTTDAATAHLTRLARLRRYFASYTQITDRTPEILSGIASLEDVEFDSCAGLTTAGIAALARLPRLRRVSVSGMPGVTGDVTRAFAAGVQVRYAP